MDEAPRASEVLGEPAARFYLATVFLTTMAVLCQATALGKLVFDLTGSPFALGVLGLVEFLPAVVLVPLTGHLADRLDRRRIVAVGLAGELVCSMALGWYAASSPTSVTPIFALVLAFGVARAFVAPAQRSLPADVVSSRALPRLVAINSVTWQTAVITGPVLAGFLYVGGPSWPFVAASLMVGAGIVSILAVRPRFAAQLADDAQEASFRDALEGLTIIRRNPILLGAISLDLFAVLFGGAVALLPAIAEDRLGVGSIGLGWLRAAGGIGAAAMAGALAVRPLRRRIGRTLLVTVAVFGLGTIALGFTHRFAVAFVALMVLSAADAISVFIRATLVPLVTPDAARGRVLAVENVFIGASNELGAFESGVVGQLLGVGPAVVLGGAATLVVAGLWWFLFPPLRDVDRFGELRRDGAPQEPTG